MDLLNNLRGAVATLYASSNRGDQHKADAWLTEFRSAPGSWRVSLGLLTTSGLADHEVYFAANSLRYNCSKNQDLVTSDVLQQVLPQLATCLLDAVQKNNWPVISQLSTAIAVLMMRAPSCNPSSIIPDLEAVIMGAAAAAAAASSSQQQHQVQADMALAAMLQVLASLPSACTDRHCSVHPNRRLLVSESLSVSPHIRPWILAAFAAAPGPARHIFTGLGMQIIHGWCELGTLPLNMQQQDEREILAFICSAVLRQETATTASETLCAMFVACKDHVMPDEDDDEDDDLQRRLLGVGQGSAQQQGTGPGTSGTAAGEEMLTLMVSQWLTTLSSLPPGNSPQAASVPRDVRQAACSVLCASASALLPPTLAGNGPLQAGFMLVSEQLLQQLGSQDDDVALTALEFWQDTYVSTLQGLPTESRNMAMAHHMPLLQHLTAALVLRSRLQADVAASATADARDLPEDVRMVRRELSSGLRDITCLVGPPAMLQYMASLVQQAVSQYSEAVAQAQAEAQSQQAQQQLAMAGWAHLECALYAANVVLGQAGMPVTRYSSSGTSASAAAASSCADGLDDASMVSLLEVCVACVVQAHQAQPGQTPSSSGASSQHQQQPQQLLPLSNPKLAGTALTLIGGQPGWLAAHSEALPAVLNALGSALQSRDDKLSRNAATTVYRLCQHTGLCQRLLDTQRSWVEQILQLYQALGGVQRRLGRGDNLPTEELLLASLCRIAAMSGGTASGLLVHLAAPKLQELQQALAALVACAPAVRQMLQGRCSSGGSEGGSGTPGGLYNSGHLSGWFGSSGPDSGPNSSMLTGHSAFSGPGASAVAALAAGMSPQQQDAAAAQQALLLALDPGQHVELAHGAAAAAQASSCLDVLHMVMENACLHHSGGSKGSGSSSSQPIGTVPRRLGSSSLAEDAAGSSRCSTPGPESRINHQSSAHFSNSGALASARNSHAGPARGMSSSGSGPPLIPPSPSPSQGQVLELVHAVWQVLQPVIPHVHMVRAVVCAACSLFSTALQVMVGQAQLDVLKLCVLLLESLPPTALMYSRVQRLATACVQAHANQAALVLAAATGQPGPCPLQHAGSSSNLSGSATESNQPSGAAVAEVSPRLLAAASEALVAGCRQALASGDTDDIRPSLQLAMACVRQLAPCLSVRGVLDAVLALTLAAARTYDSEQCKLWLEWVLALSTASFAAAGLPAPGAPNTPGAGSNLAPGSSSPHVHTPLAGGAGTGSGAAGGEPLSPLTAGGALAAAALLQCVHSPAGPLQVAPEVAPSVAALQWDASPSDALQQLAQRLDNGGGAQLVLAALLAASGDMPPDTMMNIATTLHGVWMGVGTPRFSRWLDTAVLSLAPDTAPWAKHKPESKSAFLRELLSRDMEADVGRFKKHVKAFCGGKKKASGGSLMASWQSGSYGSRNLSRSSSTRSSLQLI